MLGVRAEVWRRWLLATAVFAVTAAIAGGLFVRFGGRYGFLPFFPAVIAITAFFGLWPGIVAFLGALLFVNGFLWTIVAELMGGRLDPKAVPPDPTMIVLLIITGAAMIVVSHMMRRAREALAETLHANRQLAERLDVSFRAAPVYVYTCDRELRYTWIHRPVSDIKPESFYGKRDDEVLPDPEAAKRYMEFKRSVLNSGRGDRRDISIHTVDGKLHHLDVTAEPMRDKPDGPIVGLTVAATDVTERVETQRRISDAERLLQTVLDTTPGLIYLKDLHGVIRLVNRHYADLAGKKPSDIVGKSDREIWTVPDVESWLANDRKAFDSQQPTEVEEEIHPPGGEPRIFHTTKLPLEYAGERMLVGFTADITERKRAEQALRDSEARFRLAQEAARSGVWSLDLRTRERNWSEGMLDLFGLGRHQLSTVADDWFEATFAEDRPVADRTIRHAVTTLGRIRLEFRIQHPHKGVRWIAVMGQVEPGLDGRAARATGIALDITDRKQNEEQQQRLLDAERRARTEAERAAKMKDEFLATLSHELRTPLNAVLGWSELLRRGKLKPEEATEAIAVIERNAKAQARLIEDLLDMSRIISGKIRLEVRELLPADPVKAAVEVVRHAAEAKRIRLDVRIDDEVGAVRGDGGRLQQVVWNLLSNAIKFTPTAGNVRVRLSQVDEVARIEVADDGAGISAEFLPQVFDRFRQADSSMSRRHGGLGLGLAIVKQLVELHGGDVRATSNGEGKGATFTVELPLARSSFVDNDARVHSDALHQLGGRTHKSPRALQGIRLIIVDDEPDALSLLQRILESVQATVRQATNVPDALNLINGERPDLIITDLGMPVDDGYALLRSVRDRPECVSIPIIALTAFARAEDHQNAMRAGFEEFLTKPLDAERVIDVVARLTKASERPMQAESTS